MSIDLNAIRQENIRLETKGQNNFLDNFVPMPEGTGTVVIRLLPPRGDLKLPYVVTRTHKLNNKNLHCPMTLVNGKWQGNCPVCNYYRYLWKESENVGEDEAKKLQAEARSIKPVERDYWNAIVRLMKNKAGDVERNVGPKIFSCGKQLQSKILRAMCGAPEFDEAELGDVTDVNNGRDLKVIKSMTQSGKDEFPNYNESKFLNESLAGNDEEVSRWLENLHDLQALRSVKSYEELKHEVDVFRGLIKDPDLAFDTAAMPIEKETIKPAGRPVTASVKPKPATLPSMEIDESIADSDFFDKLRGL